VFGLVFSLSVFAQALLPPQERTEPVEIGLGFQAKIQINPDNRALMLIKFPEEYTTASPGSPLASRYGEGLLTALVLVFKCESFPPDCIPQIGEFRKLEGYGEYVYVDTTGPNKYRIAMFPLRASDENNKLIGTTITVIEIPVEERNKVDNPLLKVDN
jgi:hypothetical protein